MARSKRSFTRLLLAFAFLAVLLGAHAVEVEGSMRAGVTHRTVSAAHASTMAAARRLGRAAGMDEDDLLAQQPWHADRLHMPPGAASFEEQSTQESFDDYVDMLLGVAPYARFPRRRINHPKN